MIQITGQFYSKKTLFLKSKNLIFFLLALILDFSSRMGTLRPSKVIRHVSNYTLWPAIHAEHEL